MASSILMPARQETPIIKFARKNNIGLVQVRHIGFWQASATVGKSRYSARSPSMFLAIRQVCSMAGIEFKP